jgi:hypothetical protein
MDYYIPPWGPRATFKLLGPKGDVLAEIGGPLKENEPQMSNSAVEYPAYEVITIDGVTEIVEHRKMEPIFHVTDDPVVWASLAPNR